MNIPSADSGARPATKAGAVTSETSSGSAFPTGSEEHVPCLQIQMDLSAMLDGELDAASVRRVLVHSDVCTACRGFLEGIRTQLRAHRELADLGLAPALAGAAIGAPIRDDAIHEQLLQNRERLARVLYELGRGYVLLGTSPKFSREVAKEPVPIPDSRARGESLLDEVARLVAGDVGVEWVRAKQLFGSTDLGTPVENMRKGKRLLVEALMLCPDMHEARIYLGHAYHVAGDRELAVREFRAVLDSAPDPITRAFALENLGNVYLEAGQASRSIGYFQRLIDSGVVREEPRFFTTFFNLALAHGLLKQFADCERWLGRLHEEFPHKRRLVGEELAARGQFARLLKEHPDVEARLARSFAQWFPLRLEVC
ncbi:MAG: tetratricopeptide repeat protein [Planctomycetota bacterium]